MFFDLKTPREQAIEAQNLSGERHQLHWRIDDGRFLPILTCLHETNPYFQRCAQEFATEEPELFSAGFTGDFPEAHDGIIVSHWVKGHSTYWDEDESQFQWDYALDHTPVPLQRHSVRYILDTTGKDEILPVFECLHHRAVTNGNPCDADLWRDEGYAFSEYGVGPKIHAMRPGIVLSWWPEGLYNEDDYPLWGYEGVVTNQLITEAIAEHKARTTIPASPLKKVDPSHE